MVRPCRGVFFARLAASDASRSVHRSADAQATRFSCSWSCGSWSSTSPNGQNCIVGPRIGPLRTQGPAEQAREGVRPGSLHGAWSPLLPGCRVLAALRDHVVAGRRLDDAVLV